MTLLRARLSPAYRRLIATSAAALSCLVGAAVLFGWYANVEPLKCIVPGAVPLKPNAAALLVMSGLALAVLSRKKINERVHFVGTLLAGLVVGLGALTLAEFVFNHDLGIDRLFVWNLSQTGLSASGSGHLHPVTAFGFCLLGAALFGHARLVPHRFRFPLIAGLSSSVVLIGLLPLVGLALELLFGPKWNFFGMSRSGFSGALMFVILGGGSLALLRDEYGFEWALGSWTTAGFALGVALTAITAASAFDLAREMMQTQLWVSHRQEVLEKVEGCIGYVSQLISSERVYTLTGDESALQDRPETVTALRKELGEMQRLTADNPKQQRTLDRLQPSIEEQIEWENNVISARSEAGPSAATQMIATGRGIRLSNQIFGLFKQMQNEEHRLLQSDRRSVEASVGATFSVLPLGVFVSLAVLCLAVFFLNSAMWKHAQSEHALRGSLKEVNDLKTALDEHAIVAMTDARGKITFANDKFCSISKYSREELLGQDHRIINSGFHAEEFIRGLWTTIARGQVWHGEMKNKAKDGSYYWVDTTIVPFLDDNGKPRQYVAIRADITERKKIEEEIRTLNVELEQRVRDRTAELEAANKELEAFSYSVSHDLRAPLRAVDGFSQALVEDFGAQLPAEGQHYLQTIREGAQRMGNLIDDLLTFSRLSRLPLARQAVNTVRLVRETLEELAAQENGRQIEFRVGELPVCDGDPALLKQVWLNLLSNAFKYTRHCQTALVEVGSKADNGATIYFVKDNGTGFDMQYADKLFGVFQRLHRADEFEGTGVGLAIVQRVVHRHGGKIWADAALDRGATFSFTLGTKT